MATTFHPFPLLPYELRALIWQLAASEPRTVEARVGHRKKYPKLPPHPRNKPYSGYCYKKHSATVPYLITGLTPVPALMHTCRESRTMGTKFYQRACTEIVPSLIETYRKRQILEDTKKERNKAKRLMRQEKEERERRAAAGLLLTVEEEEAGLVELYGELEEYVPEDRYIYLNWDIDILSAGPPDERWKRGERGMDIEELEPVAHLVQRLRYERSYSEEMYARFEIPRLKMFTNLKELHIVCQDGFWNWRWASSELWPCEDENVWVYDDEVDTSSYGYPGAFYGRKSMRLVEMDRIFDEYDVECGEGDDEDDL
ncbi:hypothetical protein QBC36DRAFT_324866 [Triangularia setosa]|uniref:2EXR domain-containing protein n=1 Tax=Triangularia setosa TaxID=2587417 RepID=A0AAN6WAM4_9PEZI|nr:hypothetical protein QBC36DRAFT_324866 [Podospora setosa]